MARAALRRLNDDFGSGAGSDRRDGGRRWLYLDREALAAPGARGLHHQLARSLVQLDQLRLAGVANIARLGSRDRFFHAPLLALRGTIAAAGEQAEGEDQ